MARSNAHPKAHGKDWIRLAVFNLTTCTGHFDTRLQKSRVFFSKSVKKSVKRGERVLHARSARSSHAREKTVCPQSHSPFSDSFQTFCLTARAYNTDCFAVYFHIWDGVLSETARKMICINKLQGSLQTSLINNTGSILQGIKFSPKVVLVTKDYKIFKTKEYGMTQCY